MKRVISLLLGCLLVLSVSGLSAGAEDGAENKNTEYCTYCVDASKYSNVFERYLAMPSVVDFFGNGGAFSIFELQNPIEDCISLSVPAKITTDDPDFDYSDTDWYFLVREQETQEWSLCDYLEYEYRDGETSWASWESATPITIDAYTVLPVNRGNPVPGFHIAFTVTNMKIGFMNQESAKYFTEGLEEKDRNSEQKTAQNGTAAVNSEYKNQKNGVFHIFRLHYDEEGNLDSWKGGTGFAVGVPGNAVQHIVTTLDNVISDEVHNAPDQYRIVIFSDGQFFDVAGIHNMDTGDTRLSLCILTMSESIRDCRPLILCSAEKGAEGDALFAFGYETEVSSNFPDSYTSFPDDEALATGTILKGMNPDDIFGWLSTSLKYTEDFVGSPVFNQDGYVVGVCTSINESGSGTILSGDAIMKILEGSKTPYTRLYSEESDKAQYEKALQLMDSGEYEGAYKIFKGLAERFGYPDAIAQLGRFYANGIVVEQNDKKAWDYFNKGAELGSSTAMYCIGSCYDKGYLGVDRDYSKAFEWYIKAAELGNIGGMFCAGLMYYEGDGVEQDYNLARKWFEKCAASEDAESMEILGDMYRYGQGVNINYAKAAQWYEKSANAGNSNSMFALGEFYLLGEGLKQDYNKALEWFEKAADAGNKNAAFNVGLMYRTGEGVKTDYASAMKWYLKAAELGQPDAMNDIGWMYQNGFGVEVDYEKAMDWYLRAAELGNKKAATNIGNLYAFGLGVEQDPQEAIDWMMKGEGKVIYNSSDENSD